MIAFAAASAPTFTGAPYRRRSAVQRRSLSSSSLLALLSSAVALGGASEVRAQSAITFGPNQYLIERAQGASGADGSDNIGAPCITPTKGGAGARGGDLPGKGGTGTFTYSPADPQAVYDGDVIVMGSAGGHGGRGGDDWVDKGCNTGGANGGAGGSGGSVSLTASAGKDAPAGGYMVGNSAIVAYSHGGNGGTGGDAEYKTRTGGDGGQGGNGGQVAIVNNLALDVTGTSSTQGSATAAGIVAQSAGGSGGEGGFVHNSDQHASGGSGASGGAGGGVQITNNAAIQTAGGFAIVAQSIGGFGGDAGTTVRGYGGEGGGGGDGGAITITNSRALSVGNAGWSACSDLLRYGCNASGMAAVAAQSVGGGGGDAGADAGLHALGASGGFAGDGGTVRITNTAAIDIYDGASTGLFAQSVGGGGGKGGMAFSSGRSTTAIGGSGGGGGDGGTVQLANSGDVCTGLACIDATMAARDGAGGAAGIFAQSVGGGGGIGGFAQAKSKSVFGGSAHAVGGSGGSGGHGGGVTVSNLGSIRTVEINSPGILAQSVGGGGGSGGGALSMASSVLGQAVSVSHGGSGGSGGDGGAITVNCNIFSSVSTAAKICQGLSSDLKAPAPTPDKVVMTAGDSSPGILAQSIGGGGGNGGYAIALSSSVTGAMSLAFGGSGGSGGSGGEIFAGTNGAAIATGGINAPGVLAQSLGGGGGSGGAAIDASLSAVTSLGMAVGGRGGSGNHGGSVTLLSAGSAISTDGINSAGLLAQSIGGGGGAGGAAITLAASLRKAVGLSIGGGGGSGGQARAVTVHNDSTAVDARYGSGAITTNGYNSSAILAQSIGGGGGQGGFALSGSLALAATGAAGAIGIGGTGGAGGDAGAVSVTNHGALATMGGGAAAIQAQSIGGGGGNGGGAVSGALGGTGAISVGVGGAGGTGAVGQSVTVDNYGAIDVVAPDNGYAGNAPGILAQSIGGGGGTGGFAAAGAAAFAGAASVAVGGGGGDGGRSSAAVIKNAGDVSVEGPMSPGLVAQSLGGNGGTGGFAVAGAGSVGLAVAAAIGGGGGKGGASGTAQVALSQRDTDVATDGAQSSALVAQSIGGSGGTGGWSFSAALGGLAAPSISLGGSGGAGGKAGNVDIETLMGQTLFTRGMLSPAILAQSIGGSGGSGGLSASAAGSVMISPAVAIGGGGGNGSGAGSVYVDASASIRTVGDQSSGVVAQSIGGSGGNGGSAFSAAASVGNPQSKVSISAAGATGGNGGSGQSAGSVTVANRGGIATDGYQSVGIVAQSIGGGGGNGGSSAAYSVSASFGSSKSASASVAVGGKGAAGGDAGAVVVAQYGEIVTGSAATDNASDLSVGILAQSIGGSGGNGGSAFSKAVAGTAAVSVAVGGGGGVGSRGGTVSVGFDPYEYLASYSDLIRSIGADPDRALQHYVTSGGARVADRFNAAQYLANYSDVRASVGDDLSAAAKHYVTTGFTQGRTDAALAGIAQVAMPDTGSITTYGNQSQAIYAQSIGGGGGNGGSAMSSATSNKYAASVSVGGFGGGGGNADSVLVVRDGGTLTTHGAMSTAIFAQSVGGGGGNGGSASGGAAGKQGAVEDAGAAAWTGLVGNTVGKATLAVADKFTQNSGSSSDGSQKADNGVAAGLSIGGAGGSGGDGGKVRVDTAATILTRGDLSNGLFAQSVGGGGGNGGSASSNSQGGNASASVSLGGAGGAGGNASSVEVNNTGRITTTGSQSIGVYAQSVGGGGGNGGAASATAESGGSAAASFGLGGVGGSGGTGSTVTVRNSGKIAATGPNSAGIFAQSVGGGGGNGGAAAAGATAAPASKGDGKTSATTGSVSGAPGNGGNSATAGSVAGTKDKPASKGSGAGADGGYAAGIAIGGAGGKGSNAGRVFVTNSGSIITGVVDGIASSANAPAVFAQSVGGGGGNGGSVSSNADAGKASVALSMGGIGGGAGAGGTVTVASTGTLATHAANSSAVFAQSVGGGGGNGGSASSTAGSGGSTSVAMGLGGSGAGGGNGGKVSVCGAYDADGDCLTAVAGIITTDGDHSYGVFAQSVGGGGGSGGAVNTAAKAAGESRSGETTSASGNSGGTSSRANSGAALSFGLGGSGGDGGDGGEVDLSSAARITTTGALSSALFGQSIGGGGGAGGASVTNANGGAYAVGMGLGGSGGSGGIGGTVSVTALRGSALATGGAMAHGIFGQSVGGGGGLAGAANATAAKGGNASISMALGGSGGNWHHGGQVTVINDGTIATSGAGASAIVAQSAGAGGGMAMTQLGTGSAGRSSATLKLGATGQSDGDGGTVTVYSAFNPASYTASYSGLISTFGTDTARAQSHYRTNGISEGRSPNGFNADQYLANYSDLRSAYGTDVVAAALHYIQSGRTDGRTSAPLPGAADATTPPFGQISTTGSQASAIVAQSIGGGGGVAIADVGRDRAGGLVDATLTLGADSSSTNGRGGAVAVMMGDGPDGSAATLSTIGAASHGIIAQSIGGGGGIASFASSELASGNAPTLNVDLGTRSHSENRGGAVEVGVGKAAFDIGGMNSFGIAAQSIGGGGGIAAFSIEGSASNSISGQLGQFSSDNDGGKASSGDVWVSSAAAIRMGGVRSVAILAQSISAGGGAVTAGTGAVNIASGTMALGVSGGKGGQNAGAVTVRNYGAITTSQFFAPGIVAQSLAGGGGVSLVRGQGVDLGGNHNGSSNGVAVDNYAAIDTSGTASIGIVAQSIAGGGGLAFATSTATLGGGENGSDASGVSVKSNGAIVTRGRNAAGILAQSVGGGGGAVLSDGSMITETFVRGGGNAGDVTVTVNAPITTYGGAAPGVIAQSVAGGGGLVMDHTSQVLKSGGGGGRSGIVRVYANASITTHGNGSSAIVSMSSNDPIVEIAKDVEIIGGAGGSALLLDSPINQISNAGRLSTLDGAGGLTVHAPSGDTTFSNSGSLTGSVALAEGGANLLHNLSGGTINAGASLDLGGGTLRNEGLLANGGASPGTTRIHGSLLQSDGAVLAVRLNQAEGAADSFEVSGSGKLAGTLRPILLDTGALAPGTILKTILSAAGDIDVADLKIAGRTAILDHVLSVREGKVTLATTVDFAPHGLTGDGKAIGALIARVQTSGLTQFGTIVPRLLDIREKLDLDQAYYDLSGAGTSAISTVATQMSTAFMTLLARSRGGDDRASDWNLWGQAFDGSHDMSARTAVGMGDLSARARGLSMGLEHRPAQGSVVGIALSAGTARFSTGNGVGGDSDVYQAGIYGAKQLGKAYVSGVFSVGRHDISVRRLLPLISAHYRASLRGWSVGGRLETGYRFATPLVAISPYTAVLLQDFTTAAYGDVAAGGAPAAAALHYAARSTWDTRVELGAMLDKRVTLDRGRQLVMRTRTAWLHRASSNPDVRAAFQAAPAAGFRVSGTMPDRDLALLSANAELFLTPSLSLGVRFDGEIAGRSKTYGGAGMLSLQW